MGYRDIPLIQSASAGWHVNDRWRKLRTLHLQEILLYIKKGPQKKKKLREVNEEFWIKNC